MNHDPFASWRAAMASLLTTFATVELPYPKDEHRLCPPADSTLVARLAIEVGTTSSAAALVGFYQHCDGVDLVGCGNTDVAGELRVRIDPRFGTVTLLPTTKATWCCRDSPT
jgi:hypothetical protein